MPINDKEEYLIKTRTPEGYRIIGNVKQGNYGPSVSLINSKLLRDALANIEEGKRVYFPLYLAEDKQKAV